VAVALALLGQPLPAGSCTAFVVVAENLVLLGNNEDYWNPATRMWFVPGEEGSLGRVYFGYDDLLPQGGMNEAGLVYDGFATPPKAVTGSLDKPPVSERELIDGAMATCRSVKEAIEHFSRYNLAIMEGWNLMFADRSGDSVIIEGDAMLRRSGPFQVSTNFHQSLHPDGRNAYGEGESCSRFEIATEMLRGMREPSVAEARRVLSAVHTEGRSKTLYSNIYDLKRGLVYVYHFHDFVNEVVIDLAKELAKGPRVVTLASLFPRNFAFEDFVREQQDQVETRRVERGAVELPPELLTRIAGRYQGPDGIMTVSLGEAGLVAQYGAFDPAVLTPSSETTFYLLRVTGDLDFHFELDDGGSVAGVAVRAGEQALFFPRLP
jgi:hypothetical protein